MNASMVAVLVFTCQMISNSRCDEVMSRWPRERFLEGRAWRGCEH